MVRATMAEHDAWFMCRIGFVETIRALHLSGGRAATAAFRREWPAINVVEVDATLAEHASRLAQSSALPSLDALHLAAALVLPTQALTLATWDRRLHGAARDRGLRTVPEQP